MSMTSAELLGQAKKLLFSDFGSGATSAPREVSFSFNTLWCLGTNTVLTLVTYLRTYLNTRIGSWSRNLPTRRSTGLVPVSAHITAFQNGS